MNVIELTSLDDGRVAPYARLTEAQLRNRLEPELGIFIAESPKVIKRALDAGMQAISFLMERDKLGVAAPLVEQANAQALAAAVAGGAGSAAAAMGAGAGVDGAAARGAVPADAAAMGAWAEVNGAAAVGTAPADANGAAMGAGADVDDAAVVGAVPAEGAADVAAGQVAGGIPVYTGERELLAQLTGYELTRGVLCAMRRPALPDPEQLLATCRGGEPARRVAVLEAIVDHTNVGAIFRSAAALGVDAVLVTPTCCDPLYRRSVRVSMGTVFQVPWTRIGSDASDWPEAGCALLARLGFKTVALALSDSAVAIDAPDLAAEGKLALVLGTEGDGLARSTIASCDYVAKIPMRSGVDSLNVAAASAVAFWQLRV